LVPFAEKMSAAGLPELVYRVFAHYHAQLRAGATGFIDSQTAGPVERIAEYRDLNEDHTAAGMDALAHTVVLKLNGGLGTTMGMAGPKSLLPIKYGLTFLDVIALQTVHLRRTTGVRLPLILMDSFHTQTESLAALARFPELTQDLPFSFMQNKMPKVWLHDLKPAVWPDDPDKEWCPPGHGDIYAALSTTGMLETMLAAGYEYLFVSNSDNLGAVLDPGILGYFADARLPFMMEVAHRTAADRKGGHLARRPDGQLILRELAQCPPDEVDLFQDIRRYTYFNTNNLWLNLRALDRLLKERGGVLDLPLIRNVKPIDPTTPSTPKVIQTETAMGSAIALFPRAQAIAVPRSRFVPVKRTSDLLLIWSDVYELGSDYLVRQSPRVPGDPPLITLDDTYYGLIAELQKRFPHGAPSLVRATSFTVSGDVTFGRNVAVTGAVTIEHAGDRPRRIPDGTILSG
jgi:UTP--glucose-1-phosphate uridylyltransferase